METKIQIIKFGGTSVGSGERIRRVAHIITHKVHDIRRGLPRRSRLGYVRSN